MAQALAAWLVLAAGLPTSGLTAAAEPAQEQLAVMFDGRIIRGTITRHAVGYSVARPGGSIVLPEEQVRCVAKDLREAYRLQREQMVEPTSAGLIRLAEWCITYRLYDEAGDELRRTLRRDPQNEIARQMLAKLDDTLRQAPQQKQGQLRVDSVGAVVADVEAIGGLARPQAAEFTQKIQPLLINKCANAGCHGGVTDREFRLIHVRLGDGTQRRASEQNLAMVLKQLNLAAPDASPLLKATQGSHGGSPVTLFGGAAGQKQSEALTAWVEAVAEQRQTAEQKLARRVPLKPGVTPTLAHAATPAPPRRLPSGDEAAPLAPVPPVAPLPGELVLTGGTMPEPLPEDVEPPRYERPVTRHDPFDPAVFNSLPSRNMSRRGR